MEHVQQILVTIAAERMGDARPFFDDLEAHRRELRGMRGFLGMNISRSIEAGGDTLVSVTTRWRDEASLAAYRGMSRNAENIVRGYGTLVVADSVTVRDAEALESTQADKGSVVYERFLSSLLVPAGIFVIGLAIVYGLSRVYLEMGTDGATPLAIIIAAGILLIAWYFAQNPKAPVWQMASVGGLAALALVAGTITAQVMEGPAVHRDEILAGGPDGEEPPVDGGETPAPGGGNTIVMDDNVFLVDGAENPTITAAAGTEVTFELENVGNALHNMHVAVSGYDSDFCNLTGEDPCSDPIRISGGDTGTITFSLPAGSYEYRCDFHTAEMAGTLEVS